MEKVLKLLGLTGLLLCAFISSCAKANPYPETAGNLFIRQTISDITAWKAAFQSEKPSFKAEGFLAYSLHRDLIDPKVFILTLKCSNLREAMAFVQSTDYQTAFSKAGVKDPVIWCGGDVKERHYENNPKMTGGIVIANNQVKSYAFWKACWDAEGQHHHPGRGYVPSNYSIHHLIGKPNDTVLVAHEASDITKAPAFMTAAPMKGVMEASGVVKIDIWYGFNLEEGVF